MSVWVLSDGGGGDGGGDISYVNLAFRRRTYDHRQYWLDAGHQAKTNRLVCIRSPLSYRTFPRYLESFASLSHAASRWLL